MVGQQFGQQRGLKFQIWQLQESRECWSLHTGHNFSNFKISQPVREGSNKTRAISSKNESCLSSRQSSVYSPFRAAHLHFQWQNLHQMHNRTRQGGDTMVLDPCRLGWQARHGGRTVGALRSGCVLGYDSLRRSFLSNLILP